MLGGKNVDIILVLIRFSEMRVFSQMRFFNDFFGKLRAEKRTWANPMSSKQWKSFYEINDFAFLFSFAIFHFWKTKKNNDCRGPVGVIILVKTVIVVKSQAWARVVVDIWSGRFG